jgi:mannose-6-phosphate isomerase-like protein (cupin superfamily)
MSQRPKEKTAAETPADKLSHYEVLLDNDTTRITFHRIRPGEQSGWHLHDTNYVGYHIETAKVRYERGDGSAGEMKSEPGKAFFYDVGDGFEHNVSNDGDTDFVALEIEYKKA